MRSNNFLHAVIFLVSGGIVFAQDATDQKPVKEILAGHSSHGEAFNEGPRQAAYLMPGTGTVRFPTTTTNPEAEKFVEQGVGQLHGFWFFEAERSFRQAAMIDPECAIAYWGMAMANQVNEDRAKGFISEAVKRIDQASDRETQYIHALNAYLEADPEKKKKRAQDYTKALERIIYEYPEDIEAKALLALQLWKNRSSEIPIASHLAVDALLQQVFAAQPMHPCHHYRIHLWDYEKPEVAITSAARCGQTSPNIAHMWHMPGHIFSRLHRYNDAAWQQEASARVDHAHMMKDQVLPDQINNFAHNNEWLIRNLIHVGRVQDAVDLAKNMIELPRHPKYNNLGNRGSSYYGRLRLFQVLRTFELWDLLIELSDTPYLDATDTLKEQIKRLRFLGTAHFHKGDDESGDKQLSLLDGLLEEQQMKQDRAVKEAEEKAQTEIKKAEEKPSKEEQEKSIKEAREKAAQKSEQDISAIEKAILSLEGYRQLLIKDPEEGIALLRKANESEPWLSQAEAKAGNMETALEQLGKWVDENPGEVQPLAMLAEIQWEAGNQDEAIVSFKRLRELSGPMDMDVPVFLRLKPIAEKLELGSDWRLAYRVPDDVGKRPNLDELGPFRWQPTAAPDWELKDATGTSYTLRQFRGQPLIVIFYLGYGCLHCAEQLEAFAPMAEAFAEADVQLIAISTDDQKGLKNSLDNYKNGTFPFPLVSNADLDVFKAYRAYDDFEKVTLHGTFLIDREGMVRWQDTSFEPFMEPKFVLKEYLRLFGQQQLTTLALPTPVR